MTRFLVALVLTLSLLLATSGVDSSAAPTRNGFSASGNATLTGAQVGPSVFTAAGIEKECGETAIRGSLEDYSPELILEPIFDDCAIKALSGMAVKFVIGRCKFSLRSPIRASNREWHSKVDLLCPGELAFEWSVYENIHLQYSGTIVCATEMRPQQGIGSATLTSVDGDPSAMRIEWNLHDIEYRTAGFELLCGSAFGKRNTDATYRGTTRLTATSPSGKPIDFSVSG